MNINDAWKLLFEKYDIVEKVKMHGSFEISAKQIKEFKEPRLMAKWDSSESLPKVLKRNKINILPISRSSYLLSDFKLYEKIPELAEHVTLMQKVNIPEFETIDISNITSEANAINALLLSNILDDFLNEDNNFVTFNGRMSTGKFDYNVDTYRGTPIKVSVDSAQCEIDAGIENYNSVTIIEAKNVVHPDFHVRQLYYPFRLWEKKIKKPIRLIFSVYSNQIYRLFEYEFLELKNFSSISLIKEKNYSLQDTNIENSDLFSVFRNTKIKYDDNQDNKKENDAPFIQADSFERVISIMEILASEQLTTKEIADIMQFEVRQSDYYYNAGKYLGLFEKIIDNNSDTNSVYIRLTALGKRVYSRNYKERQLKLVELILEHRIFHELFSQIYLTGEFPDKEIVEQKMIQYNVCNLGLISRRSRSVLAWLKWIFNLPKI